MIMREFFLYVIVIGLALNLLANMIWDYIPHTHRRINVIVTAVLVSVCMFLMILKNYDVEHEGSPWGFRSGEQKMHGKSDD
jgi:hypothetical protein